MTEIVRLEDVAYVIDRTHLTPKYSEEGIPLLSTASFTEFGLDLSACKKISEEQYSEESKRCKPEAGDILFSRIGTIGEVRWAPKEKFIPLHSLVLVKPYKDRIEPSYLYYCLKSSIIQGQAKKGIQSISVPDLGIKLIKDFRIPLPPRDIQRKIAGTLEKADGLRQKRRQANQLADKMIESVFLKMFGDPVSSNEPFELLSKVCVAIESGSTPLRRNPENFDEHGIPLIKVENIAPNGYIAFKEKQLKISAKANKKQKRSILKEGDVLINIVGPPLGKVAYVTKEFEGCNINQAIVLIRANSQFLNNRYLWALLTFPSFNTQITEIAVSVRQANINLSEIRNLKIPLPSIELQNKFQSIVDKIERMRNAQNQSTQEISQLFRSLMQKAFKGELPLKSL